MVAPRVHVGGRSTTIEVAAAWVSSYFDADTNRSARTPFAYPAYDRLVTGSGPDDLDDGDLLAPTLLNAAPSIAAFYALQSARSQLERGLRDIPAHARSSPIAAGRGRPSPVSSAPASPATSSGRPPPGIT